MALTGKMKKKDIDFAEKYLETGNSTIAAAETLNVTNPISASVTGKYTLNKASVREYLEKKSKPAAMMIVNLSQYSDSEAIRLQASKDILDRAGYKPIDRVQSVNVEVKGNPEDFAKMDQIRLKYEAELKQKYIE